MGLLLVSTAFAARTAQVRSQTKMALENIRKETNEDLRKETTNLADNVEYAANMTEKAFEIGCEAEMLANKDEDVGDSAKSGLEKICNLAQDMITESLKNGKKNIDRINDIQPGSITLSTDIENEYAAIVYMYDKKKAESKANDNHDNNNANETAMQVQITDNGSKNNDFINTNSESDNKLNSNNSNSRPFQKEITKANTRTKVKLIAKAKEMKEEFETEKKEKKSKAIAYENANNNKCQQRDVARGAAELAVAFSMLVQLVAILLKKLS